MKALTLVATLFAAFLVFLGASSKNSAGDVLGNAVIVAGAIILFFVCIVWLMKFIKEKKGNGNDSNF
jgi:prepilin signal peptidase PulO-like enzyme (type II secretory pathway)